ncbi:hypothetical protein OF829_11835 [Sphingomonas sp. LB-2]|uniref:hypothetical protein n=1 Tax=Sphingomonas caeni TaxID=2984949 RepID=UPI00222F6587|nr:hypothetical protein [Sphingomonas caeni]MCW3847931.1 hypothetical protein [Sphingomonas caeni]
MMKQMTAAAGLAALALIATPAAAQDGRAAGGQGSASAREAGSRVAVGRRHSETRRPSGGVRVAVGDVNGDGATSGREPAPPRMRTQNNLKQIGIATQH